MNAHEVMERRDRHAVSFPRCPSCFRREGHSPNCATVKPPLSESEKRALWGDR
jgi:hypothetical protein